jgi:hypothetical protein
MIGSQPLCTTPSRGPHTIVSGGCEGVVIGLWFYHFRGRDLIHTQHHHNNHTTIPHMSVGPSVWGPPSCEELLCGCCVGDVNLTFSKKKKQKKVDVT